MADYNQVGAAYQQAILAGADPVQQAEMLFFHLGGAGLSARLASSWVTAIILQINGAAGVPTTQAFAQRPAVDAALAAEVAAQKAAAEAEKASKMRPERESEGVRLAREAGLAAAGNGGRPKRAAVVKAEQTREQLKAEASAAKDARAARAVVNKARKAQAEALKAAQAAQAAAAAAAPQDMAEAHAAAHEAQAVAEDAAAQADSLSQGFLEAFGDIGFGGGGGGGAGGAGGGMNNERQRKSRKQNRKSRKSRKNTRR